MGLCFLLVVGLEDGAFFGGVFFAVGSALAAAVGAGGAACGGGVRGRRGFGCAGGDLCEVAKLGAEEVGGGECVEVGGVELCWEDVVSQGGGGAAAVDAALSGVWAGGVVDEEDGVVFSLPLTIALALR